MKQHGAFVKTKLLMPTFVKMLDRDPISLWSGILADG